MKDQVFSIGDRVIAINAPANERSQFRVKGETYIIKHVMYCSNNGFQKINIGTSGVISTIGNCACGSVHENYGLAWTRSAHFVKAEEIELALEDALAAEDYETAVILRDAKV